jgi:hypothetical protein
MSYDLGLYPERYDGDAMRTWFAGRRHYDVSETQAFYRNEDTGVYFVFEFASDGGGAEPPVAFNLNYYRPTTFALEAEPELSAFVDAFRCRVDDPQTEGMKGPDYSAERFFSGWQFGNEVAFRSIGAMEDGQPVAADRDVIEAVWRWNLQRAALQETVGDTVFMPKISWIIPADGAAPKAGVTWTWGVSTILPDALIQRIVLARQKKPGLLKLFARSEGGPKFEFKLLNVEEGINIRGVEREQLGGHSVLKTPAMGSLEVQAMFSGEWPKAGFRIASPDAVFGSDLVALADSV